MNRQVIAMAAAFLCAPTVSTADVVIADDLIVNFSSLCVGPDCVDGEAFGFDTIRLKDSDPQIRFVDTSNSASFPTNDWLMGITDIPTPRFFVEDATSTATVLILEGGANGGVALGANSELVVDSISVGASGTERRVVHVAEGVDDTDAVNLGQFNAFAATVTADLPTIDASIADLQAQIATISTRINQLADRVDALE